MTLRTNSTENALIQESSTNLLNIEYTIALKIFNSLKNSTSGRINIF